MFDVVSFSYDVLSNFASVFRDGLAVSIVFSPFVLFGLFLLKSICSLVCALWR